MTRMAAAMLVLALLPAGAVAQCRLALVLALDVSSSVNSREYAIQLGGLVAAFRQPEVVEAVLSPTGTSVAVLAFEWSGERHQRLIADWTLLDSPQAVAAFADRLAAHRRTADDQSTAVGAALRYAGRAFGRGPQCANRTIDISGDGNANEGPEPDAIRATGLLDGITINGLVIQGAYPNPVIYYRSHVMQGPDAFVAMARDFGDYPPVIIGKLLREMAVEGLIGAAPVTGPRAHPSEAMRVACSPRQSC